MQKFKGNLEVKFWWIVPLILGVSKSTMNSKTMAYTLQLTPFFEISFNYMGTKYNMQNHVSK